MAGLGKEKRSKGVAMLLSKFNLSSKSRPDLLDSFTGSDLQEILEWLDSSNSQPAPLFFDN